MPRNEARGSGKLPFRFSVGTRVDPETPRFRFPCHFCSDIVYLLDSPAL